MKKNIDKTKNYAYLMPARSNAARITFLPFTVYSFHKNKKLNFI